MVRTGIPSLSSKATRSRAVDCACCGVGSLLLVFGLLATHVAVRATMESFRPTLVVSFLIARAESFSLWVTRMKIRPL